MCPVAEREERNIREPRDVNLFPLVPEISGTGAHICFTVPSLKELSLLKIKELFVVSRTVSLQNAR